MTGPPALAADDPALDIGRAAIRRWFDAALAAVDPAAAVAAALSRDGDALRVGTTRIPDVTGVRVVGMGKAARPMARAAERPTRRPV